MKKRNIMYRLWIGAIFVSLILVLFALVFVSISGSFAADDPEPSASPGISTSPTPPVSPSDSPEPTDTTPPATITAETVELQQTEDMGEAYLDKFVFLGDSTTNGLSYYEMVEPTQVWCPSNGTFSLFNQSIIRIRYPQTGEELTIPEILSRKQPEYLLITLGINGISSMDENYFKSEYKSLISTIQAASPDTKIIVNSMYPLCASYDTSSGINMDKVRAGNEWLKALSVEAGVYFVNTYSALVDSTGFMPEAYTNGDGLHLNPTSFELVLSYLRTHGYPQS